MHEKHKPQLFSLTDDSWHQKVLDQLRYLRRSLRQLPNRFYPVSPPSENSKKVLVGLVDPTSFFLGALLHLKTRNVSKDKPVLVSPVNRENDCAAGTVFVKGFPADIPFF